MDRRLLLSVIAGTAIFPQMAQAMLETSPSPRRLRLTNPHTGETFDGYYRDKRGPLAAPMAELSYFLRDFHSGTVSPIDIGVIDFLAAIIESIGAQTQSVMILSAYRTPETNAALAKTTFGVAENSQHLYGRALDVHFPLRLADAMSAARAMERGGVGWYPNSGFMHIDTGPVRNWDLEENGLGSLLLGDRRMRFDANGKLAHQVTEPSSRILPELRQSGQVLPEVRESGRIRPELKRSGEILR
jgi:uncharacterized protein YcbK (DUF882 family)